MRELAEVAVGDKEIRRLCKTIGDERVAQRDAEVATYAAQPLSQRKGVPEGVEAPAVAVVGVDGGRLQIFERVPKDNQDPGEQGQAASTAEEEIQDDVALLEPEETAKKPLHWREDKVGLLMTMSSACHAADPCPEIPASFVNPHWIPELAKQMGHRARVRSPAEDKSDKPPAAPPETQQDQEKAEWEPPEVMTKHLVATRRRWLQFGPMVAATAWSLGFFALPGRRFWEMAQKITGRCGSITSRRLCRSWISSMR